VRAEEVHRRRVTRWALAAPVAALLVVLAACSAPVAPPTVVPPPAAPSGPAAPTAAAPGVPRTVVSLTFDDGSRTQYLARPILADHQMQGTFYIISGFVDHPDGSTMTWDQIHGLAADGNDIGGHTMDHLVVPTLSASQKVHEVCDDRARLLAQGFNPVSFAYPTGAFDQASEQVVQQCGYRTGRSAGDVSETGPEYAEQIPPVDPYATDALATPPTGPLTLPYLQTAVQAAAAHGGGWVQIVFHLICQPSDPDYQQCMYASEGPVDIGVFTQFVDWLGNGAPPGTVVRPVSVASSVD
jgi:peptidoglycan/xylan/chitin deacetylase (PgdA/CDA1 family)